MRVRLKVCCISSASEARMAIQAGADALGLVGAMPSGPGVISDDDIADIALTVPPPVASVLLTSRTRADAIADHAIEAGVNTVQIVSHIHRDEYSRLRKRLPGLRFLQVIHVEDEGAITLARSYEDVVDALLLDSGRPGKAELGGTGRTHDWDISRALVAAVSIPVFLAGGLDAHNVGEAVRAVRPFGIDVCSGLRTHGALDIEKLTSFVHALAAA